MLQIALGVFLVLHGLVHLLYVGLSRGRFEAGSIGWSGRSWLLRGLLSEEALRWVATAAYAAATVLFVVAGAAVLAGAGWMGTSISLAAVVSALAILVFWDGRVHKLADQGFIGVLIDVALIAGVL